MTHVKSSQTIFCNRNLSNNRSATTFAILPLLSKSLPLVVHYPKFTANNGPPVKLRKHELRENKTHSTLDPRSMKQTTTLKKKIPRKERNDPSTWFPSWQFMCRRQHQRGNPSQSQSLFLTFSFHQTCKMFCKIFEKHFWQPFSIPKVFF